MRKLFCTALALLFCLGALSAPRAFLSASAASERAAGLSYSYMENCNFFKGYTDSTAKLLTDGHWRGDGTVDFDGDLAVAGTSVELAGTYLDNVILLQLDNETCLNRIVIRNVRLASNRYTNVKTVEVSKDSLTYTELTPDVAVIPVDSAPKFRVSDNAPETTQFFDLSVTFPGDSSLLCGIKYVRLTLNTLDHGTNQYICQFDEIQVYEISKAPYPVSAVAALTPDRTSVSVNETFTVTVLLNSIQTPNGVVACDLPLGYDSKRLELTKVEGIFPAAWKGTGILAGNPTLSGNPYYLRLLCDAGDLASDSKYNVKSDGVLGFKLTFRAKSAGTAEIKIENDFKNNLYPLVVNGADFANYSVADASAIVTVKGSSVQNLGDVNLDGEIDNLDVTMVLQYDAGILDLDAAEYARADYNFDGDVDNQDAAEILRYDAGI